MEKKNKVNRMGYKEKENIKIDKESKMKEGKKVENKREKKEKRKTKSKIK